MSANTGFKTQSLLLVKAGLDSQENNAENRRTCSRAYDDHDFLVSPAVRQCTPLDSGMFVWKAVLYCQCLGRWLDTLMLQTEMLWNAKQKFKVLARYTFKVHDCPLGILIVANSY